MSAKRRPNTAPVYFLISVPRYRARQLQFEAQQHWKERKLIPIGKDKRAAFLTKTELATEILRPVFARKVREIAKKRTAKA